MAKVRPTIKKGMSGKPGTEVGEAILLWRKFLGKPDIQPTAGATSYDFGALTEKYTKQWQKLAGLEDDGVVGPITWAMYDGKIAGAPLPVQVKAAAEEAKGEIAKANAMVAAVAAKPKVAPKPAVTSKEKVQVAATTAKEKVQEQAAKAHAAVQQAAETIKVKSSDMPAWARILTVGVLGLGALVGLKAATTDNRRRAA